MLSFTWKSTDFPFTHCSRHKNLFRNPLIHELGVIVGSLFCYSTAADDRYRQLFHCHRHNFINRHMCAKIEFYRWYRTIFRHCLSTPENNWCDFNATMKLIDNKSVNGEFEFAQNWWNFCHCLEFNPKWKINNWLGPRSGISSYLNLLASSMKGRFCISVSSFHSAPNRLLISELCILGFSTAILRRCPLLHTIKAFIGRLMCDALWSIVPCDCWWLLDENVVILRGNSFDILKILIPSKDSRIFFLR